MAGLMWIATVGILLSVCIVFSDQALSSLAVALYPRLKRDAPPPASAADAPSGISERAIADAAALPTKQKLEFEPMLECKKGEIMCNHLEACIRTDQVCDGKIDCQDGSDEVRCKPPKDEHVVFCFRFGNDMFPCTNKAKCVNPNRKCDGVDDCGDNSDELGC